MSKFQVGDRVRVIYGGTAKWHGEGAITAKRESSQLFTVRFDKGVTGGFFENELKPVPYQFKVGDIVRKFQNGRVESGLKIGEVFTITGINSRADNPYVGGFRARDGSRIGGAYLDEIELVEAVSTPFDVDSLVAFLNDQAAKINAAESVTGAQDANSAALRVLNNTLEKIRVLKAAQKG